MNRSGAFLVHSSLIWGRGTLPHCCEIQAVGWAYGDSPTLNHRTRVAFCSLCKQFLLLALQCVLITDETLCLTVMSKDSP